MKSHIKNIIAVILISGPITIFAQNVSEDTISVQGNCGMCKKRIEDAAYGKGVKFAEWDNNTNLLVISYRSDKTTLEEIEKRIASKGHTTEHITAKREDYDSLPGCCKYESQQDH